MNHPIEAHGTRDTSISQHLFNAVNVPFSVLSHSQCDCFRWTKKGGECRIDEFLSKVVGVVNLAFTHPGPEGCTG